MLDIEAAITARIHELEHERDLLVVEANQRVASYNGGIAELLKLLEKARATPDPVTQDPSATTVSGEPDTGGENATAPT